MPQTVLRGPNGGPAIDNMTGMPLTMEEMLRLFMIGQATLLMKLALATSTPPIPQQQKNGSNGQIRVLCLQTE